MLALLRIVHRGSSWFAQPTRATRSAASLFVLLGLLGVAAMAQAEELDADTMTWRPLEVGFGCDAAVTANQPRHGEGSLELRTFTDDPGAWLAFVRIEVVRRDREPFGTLGELVEGGSLGIDFHRDPESQGLPGYHLPYVALRVRTAEGEEAVLIWESPYNLEGGTAAAVPEGEWLENDSLAEGTYWMRYQQRNYNRSPGFQSMAAFADGFEMTHEDKPSLKLGRETEIVAVEIGSGPNISGRMIAYVDNLRLAFPNGPTYTYNFEPQP